MSAEFWDHHMTGVGVSINLPHLISPSCVPFSSPEYVSGFWIVYLSQWKIKLKTRIMFMVKHNYRHGRTASFRSSWVCSQVSMKVLKEEVERVISEVPSWRQPVSTNSHDQCSLFSLIFSVTDSLNSLCSDVIVSHDWNFCQIVQWRGYCLMVKSWLDNQDSGRQSRLWV